MIDPKFTLDADEENRLERIVGPRDVWKHTQKFQFEFLLNQGVKPDHRVLDIGCGVLRYGVVMIDYLEAGNYHGTDIRARCINEGQALVDKLGLNEKSPNLLVSKDFGRKFEGKFDTMTCFQLFYHLEDDLGIDLLHRIRDGLKPDGRAFADVNYLFGKEGQTWKRFPFLKRSLERYQEMSDEAGLKMQNLGSLGSLGFDAPVNGVNNVMLQFTL